MGRPISLQEMKRLVATRGYGAQGVVAHLSEALEAGEIKPEDLSIRELFVGLHESGEELLRSIDPTRKSGGIALTEAAGSVDTSAFTNLTGQIVYNRIKERYNDPEFLAPKLSTDVPTSFLDGEKIPGIGRLGDKAEVVDEGAEYPVIGLNEEWTQTGRTIKRGFRVDVTREIIVADRTGILLREAGETGHWLGLNKDKRVIDVAVGVVNNYNRNNVSMNTYLTAGAYINDLTGNALSGAGNEWQALQALEILAAAVTDPNTGEPIVLNMGKLLVPIALRRTAQRIVTATAITTVDMRANASTVRTESANPYAGSSIEVLSSPYVSLRSGSTTKWFWGNFAQAIYYMQVWAIETVQAANNNEPEFTRDVWARYKASERGMAQMIEPRQCFRSDA